MHNEIDYIQMGKRIHDARKSMNITQGRLSEMCECSSKHLSAVENGKKKPSIELLVKLSSALQVSIDSFLVDSPASHSNFFIDDVIAEKLSRLEKPFLVFLEGNLDELLLLQDSINAQKTVPQETK